MNGPSITIYGGGSKERIEFLDAQGKPVIMIASDGSTYWHGERIVSSPDFKAAMLETANAMRALVTGGSPPRSRLYARYWPYAPDWATHLATDPDGTVCAYSKRPSICRDGITWLPNGGQCAHVYAGDRDWRESCEARPC